jgi:hypothetical protein
MSGLLKNLADEPFQTWHAGVAQTYKGHLQYNKGEYDLIYGSKNKWG